MKKLTFIMILAALLVGCGKEANVSERTNNSQIVVDTLFTHDGCTVYRFHDVRTVYYAKCTGGNANVTYSTTSGKTSTTHNVSTSKTPSQ